MAHEKAELMPSPRLHNLGVSGSDSLHTKAQGSAQNRTTNEETGPTADQRDVDLGATCSLYRVFSSDDELLYVGITSGAFQRFHAHAHDADWWPKVCRLEIEHYASRDEALKAEAMQIKERDPLYNVAGKVRKAAQQSTLKACPAPLPEIKARAELLGFPELDGARTDWRYRCGRCGRKYELEIGICRRCQEYLKRRSAKHPETAA